MKKFRAYWGINRHWQLIYPVLGILLALFFGYMISARIISLLTLTGIDRAILLIFFTLLLGYIIMIISLYFFKRLEHKWNVEARWQLIAIFIVFAVNGSLAGRLSSPLMRFLGWGEEEISSWIYWPLRIVILLPIYLLMLLVVAWIFGQFKFFYAFEKKMLLRMGLGFLFGKRS